MLASVEAKRGKARGDGSSVLARRRGTPKGDRGRRLRARVRYGKTRAAQELLLPWLVRHFSDCLAALRQKLPARRLAGFGHVILPSRWVKLPEARTNLCEGARSVNPSRSMFFGNKNSTQWREEKRLVGYISSERRCWICPESFLSLARMQRWLSRSRSALSNRSRPPEIDRAALVR